jgi:carbon monoxide dehydrogenase subunit G
MTVEVAVSVHAPKERVWRLVTDIENAARTISAIETIEVLERPETGLLGLKWRETRAMFGKTVTEVMWVTDVDEGTSYTTEARSHGSIYRTRIGLSGHGDGGTVRLGMEFRAEPQSFGARVASVVLGPVMKRAVRKALLGDLEETKRAAEAG